MKSNNENAVDSEAVNVQPGVLSGMTRRSVMKKTALVTTGIAGASLFSGLATAKQAEGSLLILVCQEAINQGSATLGEFRYAPKNADESWGDSYCYHEFYCGDDAADGEPVYCDHPRDEEECGIGGYFSDCYDLDWKPPGGKWPEHR